MHHYAFLHAVVLSLVAGLIGGAVSSYFLLSRVTIAQKTPQPAAVIRAERFELVDQDGKIRAVLDMKEWGLTGEDLLVMLEKMEEEEGKNFGAELEKEAKTTGKSLEAIKREIASKLAGGLFEHPTPALRKSSGEYHKRYTNTGFLA